MNKSDGLCISGEASVLTGRFLTTVVSKDELIQHALQGIRGCLQGDQELTAASITVAVVGVDQPFKIIEGDELQPYVRSWYLRWHVTGDHVAYPAAVGCLFC